MFANYHTHTWRCKHATGTEREYVETAIKNGIKILGFSDHAPMPFPDGYVSGIRMRMDQLEDYFETVGKLKEEYKNDIEIYIGLEAEYYPRFFDAFLKAVLQYPVEYFILGQHYLKNEIDGIYSGTPLNDEDFLKRYCLQVEEALKTGYFTYLAHPDLIHYTGDTEIYRKWMGKLCLRAKELDIPLEINFLGIWDNRQYPNPEFWKLVGEIGNKVIFGADAHRVDKIMNKEAIAVAEEMVEKYHLNFIETVALRPIHAVR